MTNLTNLTWVTGLPCIGKSSVLPAICSKLDSSFFEFDSFRDTILNDNIDLRKDYIDIVSSIGASWPLNPLDYVKLYTSPSTLLRTHAFFASTFIPRVINLLKDKHDKSVYIEISPFTLNYLSQGHRKIFLLLSKRPHIARIKTHTGCDDTEAEYLYYLFHDAFSRIEESLIINKLIDIDDMVASDLVI